MEITSLIALAKDPAFRADPFPVFAEFRGMGRLVPTSMGALMATHHTEAFSVLRDSAFSSSPRHQPGYDQVAELAKAIGLGEMLEMSARLILFADPPDHTRVRRIVSRAFTPRAVEEMRARIRAIVDERLDALAAAGEGDLVEGLAFPLPVAVIGDMLGVPSSDHPQLRAWTSEAVKALDPSDDQTVFVPAAQAMGEMRVYFDELVSQRRTRLGEDLLSGLILAEDEGDRLTHDELLDTVVLLFGAGHETTVNLIAGGALNLLRHPDQLRRLRDDPPLINSAVEELLRFGPPVTFVSRIATVDTELAGQAVPRGTEVVPLLASANRDPEVFEDPDTLDIGRVDNRHLSFGGGIHLCLGAPLARVEGQEAIGRLVARFPQLALAEDEDEIAWKPTTTIRGPARLNLAYSSN